MDESLYEQNGDYYMDVRQFKDGRLELVVKTIRPMHSEVMHASTDPNSYLAYCRDNDLPTGRNVTKKYNETDEEASAYDKRVNHNRAVRRAKQNIRWLVCNMGADRLFTLSYRENVLDRERVKEDFKRFLRLVRKGWAGQGGIPEWQYVAVTEQQERGAFHIHCAVKGWQKITFLRAAWQKAIGGTGKETGDDTLGNVDVTSPAKARWGTSFREWNPAKLCSYLTKYLAKTFGEETSERKRYWHSKDVVVPKRERFILNATTLIGAIKETVGVLYFAYGKSINFARSWLSGYKDALWIMIEEPGYAKPKSVNKAVALTMTLPGIAPRRGRPPKANALTNAERQRRYRSRHKFVETGDRIGATITRLAEQFDLTELQVTRELLRFALCNKNWSQTGFPSLSGGA